ncbi:hypothetical protein GCM10027605_21670 [Micromonospora zhanjiangensis]
MPVGRPPVAHPFDEIGAGRRRRVACGAGRVVADQGGPYAFDSDADPGDRLARVVPVEQDLRGDPEGCGDRLDDREPVESPHATLDLVDPAHRPAHSVGEDLLTHPQPGP